MLFVLSYLGRYTMWIPGWWDECIVHRDTLLTMNYISLIALLDSMALLDGTACTEGWIGR